MTTTTEATPAAVDTSPEGAAARLGMPLAWVRAHTGWHTCLDGSQYRATCLVTDPDCDLAARRWIARAGAQLAPQPGQVVLGVNAGRPFSGIVRAVTAAGRVGVSLHPLGGGWSERVVYRAAEDLEVWPMPPLTVGQLWTYQGGGVFEVVEVLSPIAAAVRKVDTGAVLGTVALTRPWRLA